MGVSGCHHQEGHALGQHRGVQVRQENSGVPWNSTCSASSWTPQVEDPRAEWLVGGDQGGEVQRTRLSSTHVLQAGHLDR